MAKVKFDIKSLDIPAAAKTPLYAGVGATDLAVTAVLEYVSDVQKKVTDVQKTVTGFEPKSVRDSAKRAAAERRKEIEARVADLQADAKALPTRVQDAVNDNVATVTEAYADLAKRGEAVFKGTKTFSSATLEVKVNTTRPSTTKGTRTPAAKKATTTAAKKTAPARKSAAKKTATAKKTVAKKTSAATSTAKKTATKATSTSTTA